MEQRKIGRIPPRSPIGNVALRYGRREPIRMGNGPIGQNAAATATRHGELMRIDVTALQQFVHADEQVAVVVAGIVILNDVAEVLAIAGRSSRVEVEDNVPLRRHPLKFMIKDPAVGRVGSPVNIKNEGVFLVRIEIRRLLNPSLNALAIEALVIDLFWRGEVELRPEFAVEVRNLRLNAIGRDDEQIANRHGRGYQGHGSATVRSDGKVEHCLIACAYVGYCSRLRIHANQCSASLFFYAVEQPVTVRRPVNRPPIATTWSRVVSTDRAPHVEVITNG